MASQPDSSLQAESCFQFFFTGYQVVLGDPSIMSAIPKLDLGTRLRMVKN